MSFLGLFRKKARAEEIGVYVTDFVFKPLAYYRENPEPWLDGETDCETLIGELFLLQTFSVDYAVSLVLRNGPVRERVLAAFRRTLVRRTGSSTFLERQYEQFYRSRELAYRKGIDDSPSNPTAGVGQAFASFLPCTDSERIAEQASVEFASTATAVTRFLMRLKVS